MKYRVIFFEGERGAVAPALFSRLGRHPTTLRP